MSDLMKFMLKAYTRKALTILGTYLLTHGLLIDKDAGRASRLSSLSLWLADF